MHLCGTRRCRRERCRESRYLRARAIGQRCRAGSGASRRSVARVSRLHDVTVGGAASMKVDGAAQLSGQNLDGLDVQRRSSGSNRTLCQARYADAQSAATGKRRRVGSAWPYGLPSQSGWRARRSGVIDTMNSVQPHQTDPPFGHWTDRERATTTCHIGSAYDHEPNIRCHSTRGSTLGFCCCAADCGRQWCRPGGLSIDRAAPRGSHGSRHSSRRWRSVQRLSPTSITHIERTRP